MKSIEPYNEVWIDCWDNLIISLLSSINAEYRSKGYENTYWYKNCEEISGGGNLFNYITLKQKMVSFRQFSNVIESNPKTEEEFRSIVISHLNNVNGYVIIRVDLYDWLEGSLCWKKYHWDHYSLLVDYDEKKDLFTVFDELNCKYIKFYVTGKKAYQCLAGNCQFSDIRLITILEDSFISPTRIGTIIENAAKTVQSIKILDDKVFWKMSESDYNAYSHMDFIGVHLQRIEGRHKANYLLFNKICDVSKEAFQNEMLNLRQQFFELSNKWTAIRLALYKMYLKTSKRENVLINLNNIVQEYLALESKLWLRFMEVASSDYDFTQILL